MRPKIEEETLPMDKPPKLKKPKPQRENITPVEDEKRLTGKSSTLIEAAGKDSADEGPKTNQLANVKCLECNCVGTVMKKGEEIVLFPNKVKKTLLDLGGGFFMPKIKHVKPTIKNANQMAQDFYKGFNEIVENETDDRTAGFFQRSIKRIRIFRERFARGIDNARVEKKLKIVKMMEQLDRERTKTPARDVPDKFTGLFSDEFEEDNIWKSKKRFSLQ